MLATSRSACLLMAAPASYQPLLELTVFTTDSITGTSIRTPTAVTSAAPESDGFGVGGIGTDLLHPLFECQPVERGNRQTDE